MTGPNKTSVEDTFLKRNTRGLHVGDIRPDSLYTAHEVGELLNLSVHSIWRRIRTGAMKYDCVLGSNKKLISGAQLLAYIDARRV
jgi:hypothetical protein